MYEMMPDRRDFELKELRQAMWLARRPVCCNCGEHIQEESAVQIKEDFYCDSCLDDMRVYIDDEL